MKNYRNATGKCILFPGCNFPSFYPKTMKKLVKLLKEHGIGVAYDCCGKPIAELGLEADEKRIIQRINDEFEKKRRGRGYHALSELLYIFETLFEG